MPSHSFNGPSERSTLHNLGKLDQIDASNSLELESAAAMDVDISRLLWVRCGAQITSDPKRTLQQTFSLPEKYLAAPPARGLAWRWVRITPA
jgi:hypothetical protein